MDEENLVCDENDPDWHKQTGIRMAMLDQFSLVCSASISSASLFYPPSCRI